MGRKEAKRFSQLSTGFVGAGGCGSAYCEGWPQLDTKAGKTTGKIANIIMDNLHIYKDADELTVAVADWMVEYISVTLLKHDRFTIALSGGNTPKQLYSLLASDGYRNKIDWAHLHIFWGDERALPF